MGIVFVFLYPKFTIFSRKAIGRVYLPHVTHEKKLN